MALSMSLRWKSPDSSALINTRFKDVIRKGYSSGGLLTGSGVALEVDVAPFVLVSFDGAVIVSDGIETLTVVDGQINYVVCRAQYVDLSSPIMQMEVLTQAAYLIDPGINHLHVAGVVDLSVGGPYASVPATQIQYEERHTVDQQGRSFWRDPVATFGLLPVPPADENKDGDTRLALDTGTLYWWDEANSTWQVFDEVSLQVHRDKEHSNGITGDSVATTLEPGVAGTDMTVQGVPAGSAYTVDGRLLTAPLGVSNISAPGVGAIRGLLQVAFDSNGLSIENLRVQKSADPLDIGFAQIIDISDSHPLGTHTLIYDNIGTTLQWSGGPPVTVVTGNTYELFDDSGLNSITVSLVGAAPGVLASDNYDVVASLKVDTSLLVGYWFWDGVGTLVLGTDKRVFGTTSTPDLSDDFKDGVLTPRWSDLRGAMVYSGGSVSSIAGLAVRVSGPIVSYLGGLRYEAAGSYSGIVMTDNATNYLFINSSGLLTIQTTDPSLTLAPDQFATVAEVVTLAGAVTTITDTRDPQLIIGNATRNSSIFFSGDREMRWTHFDSPLHDRLFFRKAGANNDVDVTFGNAEVQQLFVNDDAFFFNPAQFDDDVNMTGGDLIVGGGGNIDVFGGDVTNTVGNFITANGSVTATAGNVTAGQDLSVGRFSTLQDLITAGGGLLGALADGDLPRVAMDVLGGDGTLAATSPGPYTLISQFTPTTAATPTLLRIYVRNADAQSHRQSLVITQNAAWDNATALWNRDVGGTANSSKVEAGIEPSDGRLVFRVQYRSGGTAGATWADSAWDNELIDAELGGTSTSAFFRAMDGKLSATSTAANTYSNLGSISQLTTRDGGEGHMPGTPDSLMRMINQSGVGTGLLMSYRGSATPGTRQVMREAQMQSNSFSTINSYNFETYHEAYITADGADIVTLDMPTGDSANDFICTVIADIMASADPTNTGPAGSRVGGHVRQKWTFACHTGGVGFDFGAPGAGGLNLIPATAVATQAGAITWVPNLTMVSIGPTTFDIRADRIFNGAGDVNTEYYTRLQVYITCVGI